LTIKYLLSLSITYLTLLDVETSRINTLFTGSGLTIKEAVDLPFCYKFVA